MSFEVIETLWNDSEITEILINQPDSIWFEKHGKLTKSDLKFENDIAYRNFIENICEETNTQLTIERPYVETKFRNSRFSAVGSELTRDYPNVSFRRYAEVPWSLDKLLANQWCSEPQKKFLEKMITDRKNFLVIGSTGSGKTSLLNSLLHELAPNERVIVIEDTVELALTNDSSMRLVTRNSTNSNITEYTQNDLLKRSLRLRPDRLVVGEVRGEEAKDLLLALSTGHAGSFSSLHANDPHQALYRLEMLVQMGAPQWSLQTVRKLIQFSLDYVVCVEKTQAGQRKFAGAFSLASLEDSGFCLEEVF